MCDRWQVEQRCGLILCATWFGTRLECRGLEEKDGDEEEKGVEKEYHCYKLDKIWRRGEAVCVNLELTYVPIALGFQAAYPKASPDSYDPSIEVSN